MRIALISDIHGNLVSLEAVLKDIHARKPDRIIFLGDAATLGPQPTEVIARLKDIDCPCVQGNHDEYMVHPESIIRYTKDKVILEAVAWCREQLSQTDIDFLSTFQRNIDIHITDLMHLVCYHGSPLSNTDIILSETPSIQLDCLLDHDMKDVYAGGHTHIQMVRQFKGHYVINPGSVGQPFSQFNYNRPPRILPWAEYGLLTFKNNKLEVMLKRVKINKSKIRKIIIQSDLPMRKWLSEQYS